MSLIFETLQELNVQQQTGVVTQRPAPDATPPGVAKRGIRRVLPLTAIIAACLLLSGIVTVLVIQHLQKRIKANERRIISVENRGTVQDALTKRRLAPEGDKADPAVQARFMPATVPASALAADDPAAAIQPDLPAVTSSAVEEFTPDKAPMIPAASFQSVEPTNGDLQRTAAGTSGGIDSSHGQAGDVWLKPQTSEQASLAGADRTAPVQDALTLTPNPAEQARKAARQKSERIQQMVFRLESALAQPDSAGKAQVETMLQDLARMKGDQSRYVEKMRAYWLMKQGRYTEAEQLLSQLVAANEGDLEAGLNLAIIEVRMNKRQPALDRLKRLRKDHPDNLQVADILRQLQR